MKSTLNRMKILGCVLLSLVCTISAHASRANGMIVDSSDLAKGVRLWVRFADGDKSAGRDRDDTESVTAAANYLQGFVSCVTLTIAAMDAPPFNLPENMNVEQLARMVDKYISDHPERLNEPPAFLVWNALNDAFHNKAFRPPKRQQEEQKQKESKNRGLKNKCPFVKTQSLRVTPAMEAGISDHVWDLEEIVGLLELPA